MTIRTYLAVDGLFAGTAGNVGVGTINYSLAA